MIWNVHCDSILSENEMEELIKCIPAITRMDFRLYPGSENPTFCLNDGIRCDVKMESVWDLTEFYYGVQFSGDKMTITTY